MTTELQSKILHLAAEASLAHPTKGWSEVCALTGLREKIMEEAGCRTGSFIGCLESIAVTYASVIDAFVLARPSMQRTLRHMMNDGYVPVTVMVPEKQEKAVVPALKPVPCRTETYPPKATMETHPEAVEMIRGSPAPEPKATIQTVSSSPEKASAKASGKTVKKPDQTTVAVQGSLF